MPDRSKAIFCDEADPIEIEKRIVNTSDSIICKALQFDRRELVLSTEKILKPGKSTCRVLVRFKTPEQMEYVHTQPKLLRRLADILPGKWTETY